MKRVAMVMIAVVFTAVMFPAAARAEWQNMPSVKIDGLARVSLLDDQRVHWSGVENSFFFEGQINLHAQKKNNFFLDTTLLINQRFDDGGILKDEARNKFIKNFQTDMLEIDILSLAYNSKRAKWTFGKFATPFGRTYVPLFTNSRMIAPFIRTEAIMWRETGAMASFSRGMFSLDLGLVNGGSDRDTNSSKALIGRFGAEGNDDSWAAGISVKFQDGIGSEQQKRFNSHIGVDAMYRAGKFTFSGEAIWDQFSNRKKPGELVYGNIYGRDANTEINPVGIGWYLDVAYASGKWMLDANYGEYYVVKKTGVPVVDAPNKRGIAKVIYSVTEDVFVYASVMMENDRPKEEWQSGASPYTTLLGVQYKF